MRYPEGSLRIVTTTTIAAPIGEVWKVLADLPTYGTWNPLTPKVKGALRHGEALTLHVSLLGRRMQRVHRVSRLEPERMLGWTIEGSPAWWLRGERRQSLEPVSDSECVYRNEEEILGVASSFVWLFLRSTLHKALGATGQALKSHVEASSLGARLD